MKTWHVLLGGGIIAGGALLLGGGGEASADSGEPWPWKVDDLRPGEETDMAQDHICACYRGGMRELGQLTLCALKLIWPEHPPHGEIPWQRIMGRKLEGDHASLQERVKKIAGWAQAAIATEGRNCRGGDKKDDLPDVDDDEPTPEPEPGETPQQTRKRLLDSLTSLKYESGKFRLVEKGDSGIERAAWWALKNAGVENPSAYYQRLVKPMMQAFSRGKKYNRPLFGRASDGYWAVDGQAIGGAWLPRHEHARAAIIAGRMPSGSGSQYGLVWVPKFDVAEARDNQTFLLLEEDPPQELLDLLTG